MARPLRNLAFVLEDLTLEKPAQQLLDRFLIGYPRDGQFHRPDCQVNVWLAPNASDNELRRRMADFQLQRHEKLDVAVAQADAIIIVPQGVAATPLVDSVIQAAGAGATVFVYGALADTLQHARQLLAKAKSRGVELISGTAVCVTWRLPEVELPLGEPLKQAMIVVQGEFPLAELYGLDGLLPTLERRSSGESGVREIRHGRGQEVWSLAAAGSGDAPREPMTPSERHARWPLLGAALSRSDSPQGDPVRDGRTQDLLGLGLVPQLAKDPRAWRLDHANGLRTTILVLDGVVNDYNFAVHGADGTILSAQLFLPPAPQRHEFSRLAAVIEKYFVSGIAPWPANRSLLISGLLDAFNRAQAAQGPLPTPELAFRE
jgi:hypothetical protein